MKTLRVVAPILAVLVLTATAADNYFSLQSEMDAVLKDFQEQWGSGFGSI